MEHNLAGDLANDMESTINLIDQAIDFLANDGPEKKQRDEVVIDAQAWPFAFTMMQKNLPETMVALPSPLVATWSG
jgi:hypothetical protein